MARWRSGSRASLQNLRRWFDSNTGLQFNMSDSIQKDDDKFNELIAKERSTTESYHDSVQETSEDNIENDDKKLDELFGLQESIDTPIEYNSIEEKYEQEIVIHQVTKLLDKAYQQRRDSDSDEDPFEQFFKKDGKRW